ncbi:MAG: mechanosensitive ion channel domain-containing protein, partial [Planctomycetota bacterium]
LAGVLATITALSGTLPSTLIGGLGIGGIAIALASQETLSNFIGSLTLLFDRPFGVGDWIKVDAIEGEVESLGFRSTRIRTGPNSQVTLPNSKLVATSVDNLGRRKYRRYLNKLGLEYGTPPERIEAFCEGIRELIRRHPHTRKDFYAAYFNDFGPSSLDVIVVVFFEAPDWVTELRERHRLLADILRLAEEVGVSFAFPTQTVHLHRETDGTELPDLEADQPDLAGAKAAAEIAGELPNYQDRPGRVKFPGPTPIDGSIPSRALNNPDQAWSGLRGFVRQVPLVAVTIVICGPLVWMLGASLKDATEFAASPETLLPAGPRWTNYGDALQAMPFWQCLANTLILCAGSVVG